MNLFDLKLKSFQTKTHQKFKTKLKLFQIKTHVILCYKHRPAVLDDILHHMEVAHLNDDS